MQTFNLCLSVERWVCLCFHRPHSQCSPIIQRWPWQVYCPSRVLWRSHTSWHNTHNTNLCPKQMNSRHLLIKLCNPLSIISIFSSWEPECENVACVRVCISYRSQAFLVVWASACWYEALPQPHPERLVRRWPPTLWRLVGGWGSGQSPAPPGTDPCSTRQTEQSSECPAVSPAVEKHTIYVRG